MTMLTLADVVARVESNNNPSAIRFERSTFERLEGSADHRVQELVFTIAKANSCSHATAAMIAATSWGRFQIMGETLYGICRFTASIASFLCGVSQAACFDAFLVHYDIFAADVLFDRAERRRFATIYNGPGDVDDYLSRMDTAIRELSR